MKQTVFSEYALTLRAVVATLLTGPLDEEMLAIAEHIYMQCCDPRVRAIVDARLAEYEEAAYGKYQTSMEKLSVEHRWEILKGPVDHKSGEGLTRNNMDAVNILKQIAVVSYCRSTSGASRVFEVNSTFIGFEADCAATDVGRTPAPKKMSFGILGLECVEM